VKVSHSVASLPGQVVSAGHGETISQRRTAIRTAHSPGDRNAHEGDAQEFDLHPRAAITKGERSQFFTISSESQREVVSSLEWKAIVCIWGGPVLALLSIYVLIVSWAWS
jgi:hypothetical protein